MHYVDFDKKTRQTIIRFAIYIVVGVVAFAISMLVVFAARGYDVDTRSGSLIRNGLVLVWSQPEAMDLYVNNQLEESTPARLPLPVGRYSLKLSKEGYRDWNKTVKVSGSEVIKLNSPRLFPNDINPEVIDAFAEINFFSQSSDQETIVINQKSKPYTLKLYDLNNIDQPAVDLVIPNSFLSGSDSSKGQLKFIGWSGDSRFLLLQHINGDTKENIRVDVDDSEFLNINRRMGAKYTNVQFDRSENNIFYGVKNKQLQRFNVQSQEAEPSLVGDVYDYRVSSDGRVVAVQVRDDNNRLLLVDGDERELIEQVKKSPKPQIELGTFNDKRYVVSSLSTNQANIYWLDNTPDTPRRIATYSQPNLIVHPVSFTGRFAAVTSKDNVTVHDFDKMRIFSFEFKDIDPNTLSWFDDGHLVAVVDGSNQVIEFDGTNLEELVSSAKYDTFTTRDFESMFNISKNPKGQLEFRISNLRPPQN